MTDNATSEKWSTADGWGKWFPWMKVANRPIVEWICNAAGLRSGDRVLDLASGTGMPAILEASRVQPGGSVVATDLATEMLAYAERNVREAGLSNVEFRQMNAEEITFPDGSFDVVTCQFGLMFCPDPLRAVSEIHRVLVPGGRLAVVVWDVPAKNPMFTTALQAVAQVVPPQLPPPPGSPGPFRLSPASELEGVLRAGGFTTAATEELTFTFEFESLEQHWEQLSDLMTPLHNATLTLPASELARLRQVLADGLAPYLHEGRLRFPAAPLGAKARKL